MDLSKSKIYASILSILESIALVANILKSLIKKNNSVQNNNNNIGTFTN